MKFIAVLTLLCSPALGFTEDSEGEVTRLIENVETLQAALDQFKQSLSLAVAKELRAAVTSKKIDAIDAALDPEVSLKVTINPEGRVRVARGPQTPILKVNTARYLLIRIENQSGGQQQLQPIGHFIGEGNPFELTFASVKGFNADLKGEFLEYRLLRVTASKLGKRELTIAFQAGQGTQDLGFRGEVPVLFDVRE